MSNSESTKAKRRNVSADDPEDFEEFEGWPPEQMGSICVACDLPAVINDLGLCRRCNAKLDRDMIRDRDWERSETAFLMPDDRREELREQVIREYGAAFELIEPPGKVRKNRQKKHKSPTPTSRPKPVQPPLPDEPLVDYTEQDVIVAIEAVVRATTKAYGWRHLGDIGSYLNQAFADFQPSRFGCKNLLQFIEKHPERFKVKWSAPSKKGASHLILESKKDIDAVHGAPPCPTDKKQSAELQYATDIANSRCLLDIVRGWLYNPIMPGIPMRVLRAARSFDRCYTVLVGESNEVCIIV